MGKHAKVLGNDVPKMALACAFLDVFVVICGRALPFVRMLVARSTAASVWFTYSTASPSSKISLMMAEEM